MRCAHFEHEVIRSKRSQAADYADAPLQLAAPNLWLKHVCLHNGGPHHFSVSAGNADLLRTA